MKKRKSDSVNYVDAIFSFPEGVFRVYRPTAKDDEAPPVTTRSTSSTAYEELAQMLVDTKILMDDSNKPYSEIIEFLISDLEELLKQLKD